MAPLFNIISAMSDQQHLLKETNLKSRALFDFDSQITLSFSRNLITPIVLVLANDSDGGFVM